MSNREEKIMPMRLCHHGQDKGVDMLVHLVLKVTQSVFRLSPWTCQ